MTSLHPSFPFPMWFLCYFVSQWLDFRLPELQSLCRLHGFDLECEPPEGPSEENPFIRVNLPSEAVARSISQRAVLVRGFFEVWGEARTREELREVVLAYPREQAAQHLRPESTFKIVVDGFGRRYSVEQQREIIESLSYIPWQGQAKMTAPDESFWVVEDVGIGKSPQDPPRRVFFLREIRDPAEEYKRNGRKRRTGRRALLDKFNLKKRTFLGPTSMNAELSLLIANQALARSGSLHFDPFVGTGSLLLTCAEFGAATMGGDIDPRTFDGKQGVDLWTNFRQYNVPFPAGIVLCDLSRNCWCSRPIFDGIVADPPYGVRAGAKKLGFKRPQQPIPDELRKDHTPGTIPYSVVEMMSDLLDFAACHLCMGGRLVFLLPTTDGYKPKDVPAHPCLALIANSEHKITQRFSRRLITMEKIAPFDESLHATVSEQLADVDDAPAHANFAAKFMKDPRRDDGRAERRFAEEVAKEKRSLAEEAHDLP